MLERRDARLCARRAVSLRCVFRGTVRCRGTVRWRRMCGRWSGGHGYVYRVCLCLLGGRVARRPWAALCRWSAGRGAAVMGVCLVFVCAFFEHGDPGQACARTGRCSLGSGAAVDGKPRLHAICWAGGVVVWCVGARHGCNGGVGEVEARGGSGVGVRWVDTGPFGWSGSRGIVHVQWMGLAA